MTEAPMSPELTDDYVRNELNICGEPSCYICRLSRELLAARAERDRQYEYNVEQIAKQATLEQERDRAQEERDELQRVFDLRWNADRRAIKRWQAATGRTNTWPDHADLVIWLAEQLEAERKKKVKK